MGMICRPILLHNEYVPAIVGKREYAYMVLGHHDGMTVGEAFSINASGSFEDMFFYNARHEGEQSGYSTQFFFGLHDDTDAEKIFWESDFPFTFVSFIQFEDRQLSKYQSYLESRQYVIDEKETLQFQSQTEDVRTIAYFALDSSDIILTIKCKNCETGTQMINNLHQDIQNRHPFQIRNSYSILAINRGYIDNEAKRILVNGSIEQLELRVIERKRGSINKLYEILQSSLTSNYSETEVDRNGLLGTEDEAIIIKNVLWRELLLLYQEETGILLNSNEVSQKYAAAITTKMLYSIKENKEIEEQPTKAPNTPFWDYLCQKVKKIYDNQNMASALAERKNLMMLINALRKIEYSYYAETPFNDYCFYTIMMPTAMFVKLREYESCNPEDYYKFIKYIKLCMQNFTKPDRVYQQIADFNIRYFDIPSKLIALYNAFLYYAKQVLNVDSPGQYEFLLCPGMNVKTEVKELYQGTDSLDAETALDTMKSHHLFRVEIPESHAYNPKLMFIMLGHEVSHFVGRAIRKREDRFEGILKMCGRMVVIGLKERIGYTSEFEPVCMEESIWNDIEKKLVYWLRFYIESQKDLRYLKEIEYDSNDNSPERIERQKNYYELFFRHTSTLKILLNNAVNKILFTKKNEVFDALLWTEVDAAINSQKISYDKRQQYYEKQKALLEKCIDAFAGIGIDQMSNATVANEIEEIIFLLDECYADMNCILLLHLPLKDYLLKLLETLQITGHTKDDISETKLIARIAIVMSAMNHDMDTEENLDKSFNWNDQYFMWKDSEVLDGGNVDVLALQDEAFNFMQAYIQKQTDIKPGAMIGDIQRVIRDQKILVEVVRYLLKCRREYYKRVSSEDEKKVQRFYKLAQMSDPAEFFTETASILEDYEKDIYEEIQKLIESEEGNHDK